MNRYLGIATVLLVSASAFGCSPPPKVLVGHNFAGTDKSIKVMLQDSGAVDKANNRSSSTSSFACAT